VAGLTAIENLRTKRVSAHPSRPAGNFEHLETVKRELPKDKGLADRDGLADAAAPEVIAHSIEFVAWPGKAEELRKVLPEAMRGAFANSLNFAGCLVLFPEQEARLVTVVTFWKGEGRTKQCEENSKRVEQMLFPYIEHWLRTRRLAAFLSMR